VGLIRESDFLWDVRPQMSSLVVERCRTVLVVQTPYRESAISPGI
jgi:hypothetical protein